MSGDSNTGHNWNREIGLCLDCGADISTEEGCPAGRTTKPLAPLRVPVGVLCPLCGTILDVGYGLMGGGVGAYTFCSRDSCDYFDKIQDTGE